MVKFLLSFLLLFIVHINAEDLLLSDDSDPVVEKIKQYLDKEVYTQNSKFIDIIFSPRGNFFKIDRSIDVVKVISTLKDNGLLKLHFKKPQKLNLHFKTKGTPQFFVKLISDALRNMGYYRYVINSSNFNGDEFTWSITLKSEYAIDPLNLQKELLNNGCNITDIQHNSITDWSYVVDMHNGFLNIPILEDKKEFRLKRSLEAHWLNVSNIRLISIKSSIRNHWYPYIVYYDSSLNLIKVIKRDKRLGRANLRIPKNVKYIKISDIYTLKNLKDDIILLPKGRR
jgi:hypothetical protein